MPPRRTSTLAIAGEWTGKIRSTPWLFTIRRTVNISLMPPPVLMMTVPVKTCTRCFSPSVMTVWTSTVSPTTNFGGSGLRLLCST